MQVLQRPRSTSERSGLENHWVRLRSVLWVLQHRMAVEAQGCRKVVLRTVSICLHLLGIVCGVYIPLLCCRNGQSSKHEFRQG